MQYACIQEYKYKGVHYLFKNYADKHIHTTQITCIMYIHVRYNNVLQYLQVYTYCRWKYIYLKAHRQGTNLFEKGKP